ncbi:M15 family metallopeptidase [Mycolicibacterium mengxianglii]|uniref:M15 family metallopeptidase n=1 Tax=Mycolicibacterium mengxianglii TaxID=2736649 RepID=UPI0018D09FAF|nr:M15 family metallopeptidase [Mycolicibacterium mengxianglii]
MPNTLKMAALAVAVSLAAMVAAPCAAAQPDPTAPADFVLLRDIDPSIVLDIRYITAHNFTGDPVDGYQAPMCILTPPAAEALARATAQFVEQGYSLKVRSADEGGDCAAPVSERFPDNTIDMGTGYDCFDTLAHTLDHRIQGEAADDISSTTRGISTTATRFLPGHGNSIFDTQPRLQFPSGLKPASRVA